MTKPTMAMCALALLASCTHAGQFAPTNFAPWRIARDERLEGRALVLTTEKDDAYVWSGRPTGLVGSAMTLTLPLGVIAREAAKRVFGDLFLGGADVSNDAPRLEAYRAVVSPRITAFSYRYRWPSIFDNSAEFALSLHVALLDARGAVAFEQTYESDRVEVPGRYGVLPAEAITQAAHVAAQALMLQAAADIRERLAAQAAPTVLAPGPTAGAGLGTAAP